MEVFEAMILGVVQGLTEFLPISSSGHLILAREFLGIGVEGGLAFDAVLHFATALAVLVYFRRDILRLVQNFFNWVFKRHVEQTELRILVAIIIATIPAIFFGLFLEGYLETVFRNPLLVVVALIVGSAIIWGAEWMYKRSESSSAINVPNIKNALFIGLFQSLALIPGMSRSGMAMSGGMLLGLSRENATRFAFLIAVPLLLGAGGKKILELGADGALFSEWMALAAGAASAFIVGILVIHYLLKFVRTHSLMVFVWYRLLLAAFVLIATYI